MVSRFIVRSNLERAQTRGTIAILGSLVDWTDRHEFELSFDHWEIKAAFTGATSSIID